MTVANIDAQNKPFISKHLHLLLKKKSFLMTRLLLYFRSHTSITCLIPDISSKCLGNVMRVNTGPLGGNPLEVAVSVNNSAVPLTPSLAAQCGFSMKTDPLGKAVIFASLQNCFAQNMEDKAFTTVLNLQLHDNQMDEDEPHQVAETCHHAAWASREILCERNYMEASKCSRILGLTFASQKQPSEAEFRMTTVVFFTPEERIMTVDQAQRRGYGVANTPTRLVLRSPTNAPETYSQDVAGVDMMVLKTSTIFEKKWWATQIDAAAACPTVSGGVSFTANAISWYLPTHIDPLISSNQFKLLEVHMGVDGQRLSAAEMAARHYSMAVNDMHIVVEIPVGAAGGYFKSHVQDDHYLTSYTIEPMLELLWTEDNAHEETRYKVLFPITTPLMSWPPQITDNTVPEERIFKVLLGPLGSDVALVNITFPTEVLSVADCNVRGFNVLEHESHNGSKAFTLQVPFTDPVVMQMVKAGITVYSLHLTFGLLVLPEFAPFAHTANLEAALVDIVPPSVSGSCDYDSFHITVRYGTQSFNFHTVVGKRLLTPVLAQQYGLVDNGTHFSLMVPFSAPDAAFEVRQRLTSFWLAVSSQHSLVSLAVKLESVPNLSPSQLTLRDPACGPAFSDDRFAYFVFTGSSCGTTRKFMPDAMLYENEISLPDELEKQMQSNDEPEYELKVSCRYDVNTAHAVAFLIKPRNNEPYAETAKGELQVAMRLARDDSYTQLYRDEDYPIAKYLNQPVYFEVELMRSTNPKVSLELENCWATLSEDRTSQPRWNLIINGCANPVDPYQVLFHPVWPDARVQHPSHFKRFEVQMFAFASDQENLSDQLFVHCDVVICDVSRPMGGPCSGQCSNQENVIKGQRRAVSDVHSFIHISSGPILIM
uniref:Uncharacterized LOC115356181 n=1 Tax=Myripristis murdjan TaxID=586833 RepID=A0A667XXB4_9TELE